MIHRIEEYILYSEAEQNVLPLGFSCDANCVFCSHKNIEPHSHLYGFTRYSRSSEEIAAHAEFLDPEKPVLIGDSATKISEGEPFLRKDIVGILSAVRKRVKKAPIKITTSGGHIGRDFFDAIGELAPLEINFSLNSYDEKTHESIVPGIRAADAFENFESLCSRAGAGILTVGASLMAVSPEAAPAAGMRDGLERLVGTKGLDIVRIFLPRYCGRVFGEFFRSFGEYRGYVSEISSLARSFSFSRIPVIAEPKSPDSAEVTVAGAAPGGRAAALGVIAGAKIVSVNGKKPVSRSHAHSLIAAARKRAVIVLEGAEGSGRLEAVFDDFDGRSEGSGGIVLEADIPYGSYEALLARDRANAASGRRSLAVTTGLARDYLAAFLEKAGLSSVSPFAAENSFFGGNIDCAGLLTIGDIAAAVSSRPETKRSLVRKDLDLIVPAAMLDHLGLDLAGASLFDFAEETGYEIFTA